MKYWNKTGDLEFTLFENDNPLVAVSRKAAQGKIKLVDQVFQITESGFLNKNLTITDINRNVILKTYANHNPNHFTGLEYQGKEYGLKIRNNPLVEWAIQYGAEDILIYGLKTKEGRAYLELNTTDCRELLLHAFLMYICMPVILENTVPLPL